eukprot:SAG11_NODE_198_length_12679_cov_7.778537_8_plen_57_part_00
MRLLCARSQTVMDELVQPPQPILDLRTEITGFTPDMVHTSDRLVTQPFLEILLPLG